MTVLDTQISSVSTPTQTTNSMSFADLDVPGMDATLARNLMTIFQTAIKQALNPTASTQPEPKPLNEGPAPPIKSSSASKKKRRRSSSPVASGSGLQLPYDRTPSTSRNLSPTRATITPIRRQKSKPPLAAAPPPSANKSGHKPRAKSRGREEERSVSPELPRKASRSPTKKSISTTPASNRPTNQIQTQLSKTTPAKTKPQIRRAKSVSFQLDRDTTPRITLDRGREISVEAFLDSNSESESSVDELALI